MTDLSKPELDEIAAQYRAALFFWLGEQSATDVAAHLAQAFTEHCDMPVIAAVEDVCRIVHGARDRAMRRGWPLATPQQCESAAMAAWRVLTLVSWMRERWGYRPGTYGSAMRSLGERGVS